MKKFIISIALTLFSATFFAQTIDEALMFSQKRYEGTARTMGMGNAFTALGGDIGALPINPASSGMLRYSQFTISPSFISSKSQTDYLDTYSNDSKTTFNLSNIGFVASFDTGNRSGLLNYNIGIAINRTNSFNSIMRAGGYTNESSYLGQVASALTGIHSADLEKSGTYNPFNNGDIFWHEILAWNTNLLANIDDIPDSYIASTENIYGDDIYVGGDLFQDFYKKTTGGTKDITLNFATNISDRFYFGVNLNLVSLNYKVDEVYQESAENEYDFQDGFRRFDTQYSQRTSGSGVSLQAGFIAIPFYWLRVGANITSPTWYTMTDTWVRDMNSEFSNGNRYYESSPDGYYSYRLTTPLRWNLGAALVLGRVGLISFDYEGVDYSTISMSNDIGNKSPYSDKNKDIRNNFYKTHLWRLGLEANLSKSLSLRGGYNRYYSPGADYPAIGYYTFGVGFKFGNKNKSSLDIAFQKMANTSELFRVYDDYEVNAPVGEIVSRQNKLVFTFSHKF